MPEYNMFAKDKRNGYPSAGLSPDQVSSMTYTMDELENGKGSVNTPNVSSPTLVNDNQVKANTSVNQAKSVNYNPYPGGTGANVGMDYLGGLYTSPQKEEELRKSSVNKQRVMALADALRHIGNIYHTTRYSPSQQFNNPVLEERNRYLQEKAVRDANNYKFQTYQQAKAAQEAKIRQAERDFEYKVNKDARDYELNKQKADAYLKAQEAQRGYTEARTKNEGLRGAGIEADNRLKAYKAEVAPKEFELKRRDTESRIASRKDASARGWASLARRGRSSSSRGVLSSDNKRDYVLAPSGATYSFPKGTFTGANGKANLETMYKQMAAKGLVPEEGSLWDGAFIERLNDEDKLSYIMDAASTASGHDDFVYAAKRLGYRYEGGMADDYNQKIFKEANRRKNKSTRSTVKAGATSSGTSSKNNNKGAFADFSIH